MIGQYAFQGWGSTQRIYCEVSAKQSGWDGNWKSGNANVIWNCVNTIADDLFVYQLINNGTEYQIINYLGDATTIVIPQEYNSKPIEEKIEIINVYKHFRQIKMECINH